MRDGIRIATLSLNTHCNIVKSELILHYTDYKLLNYANSFWMA